MSERRDERRGSRKDTGEEIEKENDSGIGDEWG